MSDTCVLAVSFRFPTSAIAWYSDRDLAVLWHLKPKTIASYRWKARQLGYPPQSDQYMIRRLNACRRYAMIRADYVQILQRIFFGARPAR